jgi:MtN3 and saliva related transmembrane protein
MNTVSVIGAVAALLTTVAYVPQAYKTIKTRSTASLSLPTYIMLFLGTCLWEAYGLLLNDWSIIFTNLVCGLLGSVILYLKLMEKPGADAEAATPLA